MSKRKKLESFFQICKGKDFFRKKLLKARKIKVALLMYNLPEKQLTGLGKYCFVISKKKTDMFFILSMNARMELVAANSYNEAYNKDTILKFLPDGFDWSRNFFDKEVVTMHSSKKERKKWGELVVTGLNSFNKKLIATVV